MIYKRKIFITSTFFLIFPSLLQAAYKERYEDIASRSFNVREVRPSYTASVIEWTVEQRLLTSIWDGWEYNLGVPQFLTAEAGDSYYGFGLWKPEDDDLNPSDYSAKDWILDHGINFSFGTETVSQDIRYRFDMRWHEDLDTEFLFQMQMPFK